MDVRFRGQSGLGKRLPWSILRGIANIPRSRRVRLDVAQRQHWRIPSLQHRQQSTDWSRSFERGRLGLAARRLRRRSAEFGRVNLSARAGDGRFRRRRSRHLEYRPPRDRRITAAVSNDAARLKRSFLKAADRVSAPTRRGLEPQAGLSCNCPWPTVLSASCCNNIVEHLEAAIRHICVRY